MDEEREADERDHRELLDQLVAEMIDRALDQRGTVVDRNDLDAGRQPGLQRLELRLDRLDRLPCVLAGAQHDHPADHLTLAVQIGDAAAHLRSDLNARDVGKQHRDAALGDENRNAAEVVERLEIAPRTDHVLGLGQLDHRSAGFAIRVADRRDHLSERQVVGLEPRRVDDDLVLAHHAADRRNLGDVRDRLQLVLEEPVLERAKLREVLRALAVDQRVLVDPAHTGRVGTERRLRGRWQPALHLVQVLEHARACPVLIGAILEQHVDEGIAEERIAAHGFRPGHRQHRRRQRIGDLVLDDLRRLARVRRADDHLRIG